MRSFSLVLLLLLLGARPTFATCGDNFSVDGAVTDNAGSATVALPSSLVANDILLLFIETANESVTVSNGNGGVWTEVTNSPQGTGTAGGASSTRLTVFWSRYNGTQGNPTISDSGNHQIARIASFRGCETTGVPYNVTSGNVDATVDNSASINGATTTVRSQNIVIITAMMDDAFVIDSWNNPDLTEPGVATGCSGATFTSFAGTAGNDGAMSITLCAQAAAGTYQATTATVLGGTGATTKGMMTIALIDPQATGPRPGTASLLGVGK